MKPKKILIVDDNSLNRKVFEHIIGQLFHYGIAFDGRDALEKIKTGEYHLVLMDIQMPVLDGIHTLNIIKNEKIADIPVIAVSAFANENDRDYFISTGFDDFIAKPIKPRVLLETIEKHLNKTKDSSKYNNPDEIELDTKVVNTLLKFNDSENIRLIYEEFIEESVNLLAEIRTLIEQDNYSEIGEKIHIIKGNSGTLGALRIYNFCQNFEKNIKSYNFENTLEDSIYLENIVQSFRLKIKSSQLLNS